MQRWLLPVLGGLWLCGPGAAIPAAAGPQTALVGTDVGGWAPVHDAASALGGTPGRCFHAAGVCVFAFDDAPPLTALAQVAGTRYAHADQVLRSTPGPVETGTQGPDTDASTAPPLPLSDADGTDDCWELWDSPAIRLTEAWAAHGTQGADAPTIVIADSGFRDTHVELADRVAGQWDHGNGDGSAEVEPASTVPSHGTMIAGLIVGDDDNGRVRAGVAPAARVWLAKVADDDGLLYTSYAVEALAELADHADERRILSYSLGSSSTNAAWEDAFDALGEVGVLVVTAAGNCGVPNCTDGDNDATPFYPGNFAGRHIVSVAGSLRDDALNPYSHYGAETVDLAAPGDDLCSAASGSDTAWSVADGTSYAAPLVAGTAALIWELWPGLTADEVAGVLSASAEAVAALDGVVASGGRLDAAAAVQTAVPRLVPPDDTPASGGAVELELHASTAAAAGALHLVLTWNAEATASGGGDLALASFAPGDSVALPDGQTWTADTWGAVASGSVGELDELAVPLVLTDLPGGDVEITARLVATSAHQRPWGVPSIDDTDDTDPTGEPAWAFTARAEGSSDTATDDTGVVDTGPATGDTGGRGDSDGGDPPAETAGCGCGAPTAPGAWLALLGMLTAVRRIRPRWPARRPPAAPGASRAP